MSIYVSYEWMEDNNVLFFGCASSFSKNSQNSFVCRQTECVVPLAAVLNIIISFGREKAKKDKS